MEFLNFGIILALVPICQGLVQMFKQDKWPTIVTRLLTFVIALGLTFAVREANIPDISNLLGNYYLAGITGAVVALMAAGLYSQAKADIVSKIAKSESTITVPSELVDATKEDPASTLNDYPPEADPFNP